MPPLHTPTERSTEVNALIRLVSEWEVTKPSNCKAGLTAVVFEYVKLKIRVGYSKKWPSGTACTSQVLRDGFDSRLEPIAFDIYIGWLLIGSVQAHFAVFLN